MRGEKKIASHRLFWLTPAFFSKSQTTNVPCKKKKKKKKKWELESANDSPYLGGRRALYTKIEGAYNCMQTTFTENKKKTPPPQPMPQLSLRVEKRIRTEYFKKAPNDYTSIDGKRKTTKEKRGFGCTTFFFCTFSHKRGRRLRQKNASANASTKEKTR